MLPVSLTRDPLSSVVCVVQDGFLVVAVVRVVVAYNHAESTC